MFSSFPPSWRPISFLFSLFAALFFLLPAASHAQSAAIQSVPSGDSAEAPVLAAQTAQPLLAKFEPVRGCYIGAFIENDFTVRGDIGAWEQMTKKKHASYITYVGYGRPFPADWVEKVKKSGAAPHLGFEPNEGLDIVEDGPYLRAWARDAARAKVPIFLRWASEMNGIIWTKYGDSPAKYIEKFRLVSRVMKEEAPNVAMVWTPFAEPLKTIESYYPGDEWVDWVGMNIYAVYVNDGDPFRPAWQKDTLLWLKWIHDKYGARKPIHISEFAATIYCKGTSKDTVNFAIDQMRKFYGAIRDTFPRVKSVNWFCYDAIRIGRNNNYALLDDGRVLAAYRKIIANDHFLATVPFDAGAWSAPIKPGTTLGPNGVVMQAGGGKDEILEGIGAVARDGAGSNARTSPGVLKPKETPVLLGLEAQTPVRGPIELRAQWPKGWAVSSWMWQIDNRTMAMSNTGAPRFSLQSSRLTPGFHTARVVVVLKDDPTPIESPAVEFEVAY